MKNFLFLTLIVLFSTLAGKTQTTLLSGDVGVIYHFSKTSADGTFGNRIGLVLLVDITANTVFKVTENGSDGTQLDTDEGVITITSTTTHSAGKVINITITNTALTSTITSSTAGFTYSISGPNTPPYALSSAGDQTIIYRGTEANPTFIYSTHFNGTSWTICNAGGTIGGTPPGACGGNQSVEPLTGVTFAFGPTATEEYDVNWYSGPLPFLNRADALTKLTNIANWSGNDSDPPTTAENAATVLEDFINLFGSPCTNPIINTPPSNAIVCNLGNTSFTIAATGASSYQWQVNTGSGFANISNGGVYSNATTTTLNITGATSAMSGYLYRCIAINGTCNTTSAHATLTVSTIVLNANSQTNIACFGGNNGAASVNAATGGTPSYSYNWTPGNPTGNGTTSVTGLTAGTYTCIVTDANNCTASATFTITQPPLLTSNIQSQTNIACNGGNNGSMTVAINGGTANYSYSWSNGANTPNTSATTNTINNLIAGTYTVTVTDANGCSTTSSGTITQPVALTASITAQTNITCNGGNNGSLTVGINGGTANYDYEWSNNDETLNSPSTTNTINNLTAGSYSVTVTDNNGCSSIDAATITEPQSISISYIVTSTCSGFDTGSIDINVTGGTPNYTYEWSNGAQTQNITNLGTGTYTVTVVDANLCSGTEVVVIDIPTVYTTIADGEFNDPAIWDGNCIPPNPVPSGTIVNINHPLTNPMSNMLMNDGTIIVSSPNQFINHGTFKGKGTVEGNFVNNGIFKPGD